MEVRQGFAESLDELNQEILKMGVLVEESIRRAVKSLVDRDVGLAQKVIDDDEGVNKMELDIEDKCIVLIAREQPVAGDLRRIITSLKVVTQLERMGDHAVHVAKGTIKLSPEPYMKPLVDIPRMGEIAAQMLHDGLTAFVNNDEVTAQKVCLRDEDVDNLNKQVIREVLTYMMESPKYISQSINLLFISRFLERCADHVTNISEWIVYSVTGEHVELNQ